MTVMAEDKRDARKRPRRTQPEERHTITCSMCGKTDVVPFKPTRGTAVLCRNCYEIKRRRKNRNREVLRKMVGKFRIICERCGSEATVNHKRATAPVKLCDACYRELKGESPTPTRPKRLQVTTSITCCRCGKQEYVHFIPEDPNKVLCRACYYEDRNRKSTDPS